MTSLSTMHLDILPTPQRQLWDELVQIPDHFVLYGETAIALQLGHRQSVDFDFFSNRPLDDMSLTLGIKMLKGATVTQREPNTLSVIIDRSGPVKLSFFGVPKLPRLEHPRIAPDTGLKIASLLDLAGTKVSVVQLRAEPKDYQDIDAVLTTGGIVLETALAAAVALYGEVFNPQAALKALVYFEEEALRQLPDALKQRLVQAVKHVDLDRLPALPPPVYSPQP
jgi:hypothetical protein